MESSIAICFAIDDRTRTSLSVTELALRFCSRRGPDSTPQVNRVALLSALVKAYKPRHREGRANLPGLLPLHYHLLRLRQALSCKRLKPIRIP